MINQLKTANKSLTLWASEHQGGFFIFVFLVLVLVTLHSIGYFDPYFKITASLIIVFAMISSIFLLGVRRKQMIILSLAFWTVGFIFKVFNIDIWAERIVVYAFYSLLLVLVLYVIEST